MTREYIRASVPYRVANGRAPSTSTVSQPRVASARPTPDDPRHREREHGQHAGQGPDRHVAGAEDLRPDVQEEVVERRVAVVAQGLADVAQGQAWRC